MNSIEKVDILNREEYIDRAVQLVKLISSRKGNMTFAITGEWGSGKTFVLDKIQENLSNDERTNFLVIPYNCWQYDYYDEPLVAIVAALLDFAETTRIIPEDMKTTFKQIAFKVGVGLVTRFIKEKSGIDLENAVKDVKDAVKGTKEGIEEAHEFDSYYSFKKALLLLKEQLEELAENHTLVFAVDELDRCLPEYAIKVLERLHHIAEDVPNMITIVAVDKKRLENTVNSIFGNKDDKQDDCAEKYLKKFIRFELHLDKGKQNSPKFFDKFPEYYERFDATLYEGLTNTEQFLGELFSGIDIRSQERIVEKATLFNDICFGDEKQDHTMMYMELFYATLYYHYKNSNIFNTPKQIFDRKDVFANAGNMPEVFRSEKSGFRMQDARFYPNPSHGELIVSQKNIYAVILLYWYYTPKPDRSIDIGNRELIPKYEINTEEKSRIDDNIEKLIKYIDLLKTIA